MDSEIKFVHREETFNDLAVRELAKNKAACICRLQFGRCKKSSCSTCGINKQITGCLNQMSDYDRLRLNSYTANEYIALSANPNNWRTHKSYVLHYLGFVCLLLLFMGLLIGIFGAVSPGDMPSNIPFERQIKDVRQVTNIVAWDIDKDGTVDCCDYAILFKILWDLKYPAIKNRCEIVRNYNPGIMNHLFIGIRNGDEYIFVEPWARQEYYDMAIVWGDKYNVNFNRYGETLRWLETIR